MDEEDRPTGAFILSLIGAVLVLIEGIVLSAAASIATDLGGVAVGGILGGLGFLDVVFGFLLIVLAVLMLRNPDAHTVYGVAILICSLFSLVGGGGFLLGLVLGCIGGVLAILYVPTEPAPAHGPGLLAGTVSCPSCGSQFDATRSECPRCGASRW